MRTMLAAVFAVILFWPGLAGAEARDTLEEIRQRGRILVGHRESSVPFSYAVPAKPSSGGYVDNDWGESPGWSPPAAELPPEVMGYSQEYSNRIVEAIKKELGRPDLIVEYVLITPQNRISLLAEGGYDFECGSTTNNTTRQKEASFSNSIFVVGTRILAGKDSSIKDYADLKGKTMAVAAGTTSERLIAMMNDAEGLEMKIVQAKSQTEAFKMVESGRADAFFFDDALLAGERSRAANPGDWVIVGLPQTFEAYGCLIPKGDDRFKKLVDETVAAVQTSGEGLKFFEKWFQNPIPPDGLNMGFELSPAMEHLLKNPNDHPYQ